MQLSRTAPIALVTLILLSGCASLRDVVSTIFPQQQNVNLSLMPGTRVPQPSWIDGDLRSGGESERPPEPGTKSLSQSMVCALKVCQTRVQMRAHANCSSPR